ncbi:Ribonuclease P protein subunit p20 [Mycena venus]|uniref:Ribonuclease P protein subunit p20 n=1 Tax=Mycena venus TaxID=2733690 RepID=A0A8H6Y8W9_9AGAR|nr:Ribonuclease P protein subunit p20 [Mycena venus]
MPKIEPQRQRINKLAPARPFPTVPASVSATGPRSAHKEGKNLICITRKTPLATYLRRCKNVIINDGYKILHLSAMGAAIPHLLQLAVALPPILPFAADEIHSTITTGTMEVQDEIIPDDEDEDITYRTRGKSTLLVVIKIGDGEFEGDTSGPAKRPGVGPRPKHKQKAPNGGPNPSSKPSVPTLATASSSRVVVAEPDQDEMET